MKRYEIILAREAEKDLHGAVSYIAKNLREPVAAENLLNCFEETVLSLETMPQRFPVIPEISLPSYGIRIIPVKNYLAFYTVNEDANAVYLIRFLYGKRNWVELLKE